MTRPSLWKDHRVTRFRWKQNHNAKALVQAQDSSGYGSQRPSSSVARDEPIDLTESNSTQRELSPSHPSSTGAIALHPSRKRKIDNEGQLLVEPRTRSDAVSIQNTPQPHIVPLPRFSDGKMKKVRSPSISSGIADISGQPYGGAHQPQNSLNQSRFTQSSPRPVTYGKSTSLAFKSSFRDNVSIKHEGGYEFPDDDNFAKRRRIQKSSPNTSSPGEPIELDEDERRPVRATSPLRSSQESLPQRNSQVSSTSKRNADADSHDSQILFRGVETRMKPNSKRTKPGPNVIHTPQTPDSGQVSPYFAQSDRHRIRHAPSSRIYENRTDEEVERRPKQHAQLHSMNIDDDDVVELKCDPRADASCKRESGETRRTEKGVGEIDRPKSSIHVRTPATTSDRTGISIYEDPDTSVDELHGPATVGNAGPNDLPSNRKRVGGRRTERAERAERAERHDYDVLVSPEPQERKSVGDIPSTRFSSGDKQEPRPRKAAATKKRRVEAPSFVLDSLNLSHDRRLYGPNLALKYESDGKEFNIFSHGSPVYIELRLAANNVNSCWYSHPYVRLRGPKIDDHILYFDLKFINEESSKDFLRIVDEWRVHCYRKSNDEMSKIFLMAGSTERTAADKKEMDLLRKRVERGVDRQTIVQEERKPRARENMLSELLASAHGPDRQVRSTISRPSRKDKPEELEVDLTPPERRRVAGELRSMRTRAAAKRQRLEHADEVLLEEEKYSVRHGLGETWDQPVVYPRTGKKRTTVEQSDLVRLDEGEFLNDSLIEFYIRWLSDKFKIPERQVYFFSTHFYTALTRTQKGQRGINYAAVERWTAKEDIFTYDFVIVPVNEATHWYLVIICNLPNVKRKFDLDDERNDANDRIMSSDARVEEEGPDVMDIDLIEAPPSPTDNLSMQYSNLKVDKQSHVKRRSREQSSLSGLIYLSDEEEERPGPGTVKQAPATPRVRSESDALQSIQTSDIGVFADAKPSPSGARKARRKSGPPPRKYDPSQPAVIILDSLISTHAKTISNLKDYLIAEGASKCGLELSRDDFRGINAKEGIPQQDNSCDCGLYLLGYIHKFMEDPKQFGRKLLSQEFDLHNDWPNMVPSAMRNGIRNELMRIHAEQKAEREANRKAKKAAKKMSKAMAAMQAAAGPSEEKEVITGSTASRGETPRSQNHQQGASTGQQNSLGQQPIEDKKSHSPQTSPTVVSSTRDSKPLWEYLEEVDAQKERNAEDAMLFDEHQLRTPVSQIRRFRSAPPSVQDMSEMEVDWHGQLRRSVEAAGRERLSGSLASDPMQLLAMPKTRGKSIGP